MPLLNEYAELEEIVPGQFHLTQHLKKIAYRESGSLLAMVQDWVDSGVVERPHKVDRAPIMVSTGEDGMRRMHPTRELDRYIELGAPFVKTGGVWGKVNLGTPTRTGSRLQWTRPQANMYVDFGGHFVKLSILLKGGYVPEDSQIAFPVGMQGFTRSGGQLLRDGVPVARLAAPVMLDFSNPADTRPIDGQFINIAGQPYWHMTLPDLTGMVQPVIDPTLALQPDATAGKDTYIKSSVPTFNYGVNNDFNIGESNTEAAILRALIDFDLSSIPASAILSASSISLKIRLDRSTNARTFRCYRIRRSWTEGTGNGSATADGATWNTYDGVSNWATAGAGNTTTDREGTGIASVAHTATETVDVFKAYNLTGTSLSAITLGFGWIFVADTETDDAYIHYASDAVTAGNRPKFDATYTVPAAAKFMYYARRRGQ